MRLSSSSWSWSLALDGKKCMDKVMDNQVFGLGVYVQIQ